ncbi:MAG: hypothetical protein J0M24_23505 [Verrucomicrobia bacterium]|nr:hypothetical protein [Verrucomicrobiota bacterium]
MHPSLLAKSLSLTVVLMGFAAGCSTTPKPELTSEQIMEEGFKGKTSLAARLSENMGTQADKMRMVYLTQQLALNQPPKGDLASWTEKTTALTLAAVALEKGSPDALVSWKAAADCKKCHTAHKPD